MAATHLLVIQLSIIAKPFISDLFFWSERSNLKRNQSGRKMGQWCWFSSEMCAKNVGGEESQEIKISRKVCWSHTSIKVSRLMFEVFFPPLVWHEWNWWFELIKVDRMLQKIRTGTTNPQTFAFLKPSMKNSVFGFSWARCRSSSSSEKFAFSVKLPLASAMNCVCAWVKENQFPRTSLFVFLDKSSSIGKHAWSHRFNSTSVAPDP